MNYPPAEPRMDGQSGGSFTGLPYRIVLHTTETAGLPGYRDGTIAPHLTYLPNTRQWIQHVSLDTACRSLRNEAGGAETNRANALQVEIVCYSAEQIVDRYPNTGRVKVSELPDTAYEDLRDFIVWCMAEYGVQPVWPERQAFSYSEANAPGFRMSIPEWEAFNGVCGHQHVGEGNTHWDPGALDWSRIMPNGSNAPNMNEVADWAKPAWEWAYQQGLITSSSHPKDTISKEELMVFFKRYDGT